MEFLTSIVGVNFRPADAKQAVAEIASVPLEPGKSNYIEPGHIIAGVRRIRSKRLELTPIPPPPPGLSVAESVEWQRRIRDQIAAGTYVPAPVAPMVPGRRPILAVVADATPSPERRAEPTRIDPAAIEAERARQLAALEALTPKEPA